ncbi:PREDICTED: uncharacterized protein LOC108370533 [Rhagoletis zephyria]|uniref:uncharacterized protein LOC108370533 n=1 Tax=Rhagoletis zephyria TaxID=28612 RepID=UPI000811868A|nr:PREDICTED: uncharacterized protein LOC108370533 [Rhagoletis zephyria]
MRKVSQLPRTSRVNEKIIDYYLKFGQERDLEKYMRLYSPCGHHCESRSRSTTTISSCHSEDEGRIFRRLFDQDTETSTESDSEANEVIVPIDLETKNMPEKYKKPKGDECTSSAPDLHTPPPRRQKDTDTRQTQTPESIAKSHRRLEWDSLGDVGYKKSLSTSNISILERSVLKEYFQEISSISSSKKEAKVTNDGANQHKQDKQKSTHKAEKNGATKIDANQAKKDNKPKETNQSKQYVEKYTLSRSTPPLASSTMMTPKNQIDISNAGSRPKLVSTGTSMSLQKRYDQYAQTSLQRLPQLASREVQVTMSSAASATSSTAADTATPSSFDYYSSRSTHSTTDVEVPMRKGSINNKPKHIMKTKERQKQQQQQKQMHPFVAGLHEMLASNKTVSSKKDSISKNASETNLLQVHDTLKQMLTENKENSTASSSLLNSPQLDLGIQLLCSLIDARSLNQRQKKKLVRDIVKRISTLNIDDNVADGGERMANPCENVVSAQSSASGKNISTNPVMEATIKSTSTVTIARTAKGPIDISDMLPNSTSDEGGEQLVHVNVISKPSPPTTSAKALAKMDKEKSKNVRKTQAMQTRMRTDSHAENGNPPRLTDLVGSTIKETSKSLVKALTSAELNLDAHSDKDSSVSKASTTSRDVTTQKTLINVENAGASDTDLDVAGNSTMREWLNPMTKSEIEYEEKKLELARHAAKRDKILKRVNGEKMDTERRSQLKWIQSEIQRLETLRSLLSKPNMERDHEGETIHSTINDATAHEADKLYDTVFSDQQIASMTTPTTSSTLSSGNKPMQEIEVIIEESNEDVIVLDDKIKRSKQRKRETQTVYDKPTETANTYDNLTASKARFRTVTETVTTKEEQVLPTESVRSGTPVPSSPPKQLSASKQRQQQRSKIDTPSYDSNDGESVGSFAKQRKREFLEQYRNKKRIHYESLLHQQQQLLIQQQQQIIHELQQRCNVMSHTPAGAAVGHYSVPLKMHNNYCPCVAEQRPYHQAYFRKPCNDITAAPPRPHTQPQCAPCPPCPPRAQTHQSAEVNYSRKTQTIHSEQSTSSIFCISSEVSIPMGSSNTTSSTTTTTHQYDDVAGVGAITAGVGVQTGASLRRTQPIFGRRLPYDHNQARNLPNWTASYPQPVCSGQSISVQVKPKAIAYVIQFDKKTMSTTTTTTTSASQPTNSISKPSNEMSDLMNAEPKLCALQDYLVRAKPQFVAHTKERKAILNQIQALRQERGRELRDIIENASENSMHSRLQRLPPPATKRLRIFATKEMKAITQRHFQNLPEVVKQQERVREERHRNGNRLIRDIFNQRLQRRVRTGKLSLNHSKTVI